MIMDSFSCTLFVQQLHLNFYVCYFINITLKYKHFLTPCSSRLLLKTLTCLTGNDVKNCCKISWRYAWESSYTPWCKMTLPCTSQSCGNSCRVCKKCTYLEDFSLSFLQRACNHDLHSCTATLIIIIEPQHDKTNNVACALSEDSDQPGHLPSLIRVFGVRSMGS